MDGEDIRRLRFDVGFFCRWERCAVRIGICDDEREVRDCLGAYAARLCRTAELVFYEDGTQLLSEANMPDILFLDIQMPGMDGMETARRLRKRRRGADIILIFVTAAEEYVFDAFDVEAFQYLVKPFSEEKFAQVLGRAAARYRAADGSHEKEREKPTLMITVGGAHINVRIADIIYAEVYNRKVMLHTVEGDLEYYGRLKDLEKAAGGVLFRTHRAYLVNFAYVKKYNASCIDLQRGQAQIAKQHYQEFVKHYLRFNQRKANV